MKRLRKPRLRNVFGLLIVPPSIWALIVALLPTGWARDRVDAALERATGQPVRIDALRLGLLGDVKLLGLEIGAEAAADDGQSFGPWLRADAVRVDLNLSQLLSARLRPGRCTAEGIHLRVLRRRDGSLEFGDLLADRPDEPRGPDPGRGDGEDSPIELRIEDATVQVLDEPTGTELNLSNAMAEGLWSRKQFEVAELTGDLNGGRLDLALRLDRGGPIPYFEGELIVQDAELAAGLGALAYLVPAVQDAREALGGRVDLSLGLRGRGNTGEEIARTLAGQGRLALRELSLEDSPVLSAVAEGFRLPVHGRFGSLQGDFLVADRRVATRNLSLELGPVPIMMAGWTDFDGRLDYLLRIDNLTARVAGLSERLSPEAQSTLSELNEVIGRAANLRLQGDARGLLLTADGVRVDEWVRKVSDPDSAEFGRLREIGRNILNRGRLRR